MTQTAEAATAAVQAFLADVPGSYPGPLEARPFEDGHLVRSTTTGPLHTGGLFLVHEGRVRFVGSGEVPRVHQIWAELVAEPG